MADDSLSVRLLKMGSFTDTEFSSLPSHMLLTCTPLAVGNTAALIQSRIIPYYPIKNTKFLEQEIVNDVNCFNSMKEYETQNMSYSVFNNIDSRQFSYTIPLLETPSYKKLYFAKII